MIAAQHIPALLGRPRLSALFTGGAHTEGAGRAQFTLTTKWQRDNETSILPPKLAPAPSVGVEIPADQRATVWCDAMPSEQGVVVTAFEP